MNMQRQKKYHVHTHTHTHTHTNLVEYIFFVVVNTMTLHLFESSSAARNVNKYSNVIVYSCFSYVRCY